MGRSGRFLVVMVVGLGLSACTFATPREQDDLVRSYSPMLVEVQEALTAHMSGVTWAPVEGETFREDGRCKVRAVSHGRYPAGVHWDPPVVGIVSGVLVRHDFKAQRDFAHTPGGWMLVRSSDHTGAKFEYLAKGTMVDVLVEAPRTPSTC